LASEPPMYIPSSIGGLLEVIVLILFVFVTSLAFPIWSIRRIDLLAMAIPYYVAECGILYLLWRRSKKRALGDDAEAEALRVLDAADSDVSLHKNRPQAHSSR